MQRFFTLISLALAVSAHPMLNAPLDQHQMMSEDGGTVSIRLERREKHNIHKKLTKGSAATRQKQINNNDLEYIGTLNMGDNLDFVDVVWDTGSQWLIVASDYCNSCDAKRKYNQDDDDSFNVVDWSARELQFGIGYVYGYHSNTLVCTRESKNSCTDMDFILMTYQEDLFDIGGIAGLATGGANWSEGDLVIQKLYQAGLINRPVFGFYLTGTDGTSFLDIGGLYTDAVRDIKELVWLDVVEDDFWWTNYITAFSITYADTGRTRVKALQTKQMAFTDSGTSCTYIPAPYFEMIMGALENALPRLTIDWWTGERVLPCEDISSAPTISFEFGGYWFTMEPKDYINNWYGDCWICMFENEGFDGYWLLGDTFLRGYYSVHDYESMRFGFAPHSTSDKPAPFIRNSKRNQAE